MPRQDPVIVVGAGAAGILAAWRAATLGAPVTLLEKNDRIGIKILISGGGRCNITHDGSVEALLSAFRPNEARFLRPSSYRFTNRDILEMLTSRGLEVYTRPDGRVFPLHGTAKDVVAILGDHLAEAGVRVKLEASVTGVVAEAERVTGVRLGREVIPSHHVVLAVGGSSYPGTGTTGDGWAWARDLGHSIVKVRAALAPIFLQPQPPADWAGVALRDCVLKARQAGREIARWRGDLLFTHRGISGPTVLGISRVVAEMRERGPIGLEADFLPDESYESLAERLKDYASSNPRRQIPGFVEVAAPARAATAIMEAAGVDPCVTGARLRKTERNRLVATLKGWRLGDSHHVPLEKGEVVAGGIALDEVDSHSMRSLRCRGLYVCGEILDIAGPVGGYNLQAAFSAGYAAGQSAAEDWIAGSQAER